MKKVNIDLLIILSFYHLSAKMDYTVEVLLGNRYGIDFDTRLYFVLMNEIGEQSEKFWSDKVSDKGINESYQNWYQCKIKKKFFFDFSSKNLRKILSTLSKLKSHQSIPNF